MFNKFRGNILIVDDVAENLQLLTRLLHDAGYKVRPASSGALALKSAISMIPDLIMLDITMPEMDGFEVCRQLKKNPDLVEIPVIFISALNETVDKVTAFNCGGVDFVSKPFDTQEVLARVNVHVTLRKTLLELEKKNLELDTLAKTDYLTGVLNRREVVAELHRNMSLAKRHNHPFSIILIDIDYFKQVNDTFGHQIGDEVLKNTTEAINSSVRESDVLGRFGGEEFIILAPYSDIAGTALLAERVRKAVEQLSWNEEGLHVTISLGVAELEMNDTADTLIKRADQLLYCAKDKGRNRVAYNVEDLKDV